MKKSKLVRHTFALIGFMALGPVGTSFGQEVGKNAKTGKGLYEIVYSSSGNAVYVASAGSRGANNAQIYKLDPVTLQATDSIALTENPGYGLGINDKTQTLYTSNTRNNSVHAIDLKTGQVKTIVPAFEKSHTRELVVDEQRNKIYVSDVGKPSKVWVIDGSSNTLERVIENTGESTTGMALNQKEQLLYLTNLGTNEVAVLDLKSDQIIRSFPAGAEGSVNIELDKKTNRLFVANQTTGVVTVLDAGSGELLKTIPTGEGALGIRFDQKNERIFAANRRAGTVTVIDSNSYEVLADLKTGTHPNTVAINPKTGNAYVTNKAQSKRDDLSFVDPNGDVVTLITFE